MTEASRPDASFDSGSRGSAAGMAVTPSESLTMTTNDQGGGRSLAPLNAQMPAEPGSHALADPIALVTQMIASDDPSVDQLVGFRRQPIDLKAAARNSKSLQNEEFRLSLASEAGNREGELACAGLKIMSLAFVALTAVWPADDLDQAEAKLALADKTGALHHRYEPDFGASMEPAQARRLRWKRAAFAVPELMLPAAPPPPKGSSHGLSTWPLERWDLAAGLPLRGGPPAFAHAQIADWAGFARAAPDLNHLLARARQMFATCDRLLALAARGPENASELMVAADGARIAGYLAAAQVMIWPIHNRASLATKREAVALINLRGIIGDPVPMQAAIRHVAADAAWIRSLPVDARDDLRFDWSELV
jgi:hypothetical protein